MIPPGIYVVSAFVFVPSLCLLCLCWMRVFPDRQKTEVPDWRSYCIRTALFIAISATPFMIFGIFSYLKNGGGIHGSMPTAGVWMLFMRISNWAVIATFLLAFLGKGKGKVTLLGWGVSLLFAEAIVVLIAFD